MIISNIIGYNFDKSLSPINKLSKFILSPPRLKKLKFELLKNELLLSTLLI